MFDSIDTKHMTSNQGRHAIGQIAQEIGYQEAELISLESASHSFNKDRIAKQQELLGQLHKKFAELIEAFPKHNLLAQLEVLRHQRTPDAAEENICTEELLCMQCGGEGCPHCGTMTLDEYYNQVDAKNRPESFIEALEQEFKDPCHLETALEKVEDIKINPEWENRESSIKALAGFMEYAIIERFLVHQPDREPCLNDFEHSLVHEKASLLFDKALQEQDAEPKPLSQPATNKEPSP